MPPTSTYWEKSMVSPYAVNSFLQQRLKANRFGTERKNRFCNLSGFIDVVLCQRRNVLGGLRMGRYKPCGGKLLNLFQRVQIGAYVIDDANLILFQGLLTGQAVGKINHTVLTAKTNHVEEMARKGKGGQPFGQRPHR